MNKAIAIGMLGLRSSLTRRPHKRPWNKRRSFVTSNKSVVDYTQRDTCLSVFPEAITAATPAPKVFTLPVAMVFRQLIARAIAAPDGTAIGSTGATHRAVVLQPFPATDSSTSPGN